MPKPIKRKISKQDAGAEETVKTFMHVAVEKIESNSKQAIIAAAIVLAVIIAVAGAYYLRSSSEKKAERTFYEGYKAYHGLYDAQALTQVERYERSLASFKQSYEAKHTPQAMLYIANSQNGLGRYDEALKSLSELESTYPDDEVYVPLARYKTAVVQLKAGRTDEALATLDKLYSGKSVLYRDMALAESARVLDGLGKRGESVKKYETLLKEFPNSPFVPEAQLATGATEEKAETQKEEAGAQSQGK